MKTTQLFFNINKPGLNNEWNKNISIALKELSAITDVFIIEKNESSEAQINISYDAQEGSLYDIESLVKETGATIIDINIHFPSGITGVTDAYGASAVSLTLDKVINMIEGVLGVSISSSGIMKVELDPAFSNKNNTINRIIQYMLSLRQ